MNLALSIGDTTHEREHLAWEVGHAGAGDQPARWVTATVPGAVQLDWAAAEGWPPYWQGDNCKAYRWMEDVWWTYRTKISPAMKRAGRRLFFVCGGVDYHYSVHFGGRQLYEYEGMFTPFELDLTDLVGGGGWLEIRLRPVPKAPGDKDHREQARLCVKPAVAYGWDWHPRLIPLGIWQETYLEYRPDAHWTDLEITYSVDVATHTAELTASVAASPAADGSAWRWTLRAPDGEIKAQGRGQLAGGHGHSEARLTRVELWWPHDQGPQPLYTASFELLDASGHCLERQIRRIGFRRVRLVMHEGAWAEPEGFPKSRSHPPITLEINGRSIFCRGSNWVPPEIFPGTITGDTYRPLLNLAREAGFNLLRNWGGGIVNKQSFFDQCDELGLMVWQEFPLACNLYEDDPHYLRVLDAEARTIIRQVRQHPCLAMWSGGNELFNAWSGMTDQSLALRGLNRRCLELDPATPFIPTSPIDGVGHGDYRFRDDTGREVHQIFAPARNTAYTEFGCPGPSPVAYLERFIPPAELWPPREGTAWETHHAFHAWWPADSWLFSSVSAHYFGESPDLPTLVARGEWLQCEGYKVLFEEARRQKPHSAMALNWCYNEPWPTAANNSIIAWPAEPKPAYFAVAAACRPVMASAQIPRFSWSPGEKFEAELWLFNDSPDRLAAGRLTAFIEVGAQSISVLTWEYPKAEANHHVRGPRLECVLPAGADRFTLRLVVAGETGRDSAYVMPLRAQAVHTP
jgi:beta-mannosidase